MNIVQLELVGCTGAGKSTLAARIVAAARAQGAEIVLADDVALRQLGMRGTSSRWLRVGAIHLVAFFQCVISGRQYFEFIRLAHRVLRAARIPRPRQWNQLRKVLKQLGRYDLVRRRCQERGTVLVDEGTIHAAHNLFVHVDREVNRDQLQDFAECVPLPDIVVYVRSREDTLVERTLERGHPRIPNPTPQVVASFVRQAVVTFDTLSRHKRIAPRTLVIEDGVVVSEPCENGNPQTKTVLDVIRRAVRPTTPTAGTLHFEPVSPIHGGASPEDMQCSR